MCKLLVLKDHPQKLVACKNKCFDGTSDEVFIAAGVLYVVAMCISALGLYLLS